MPTRLHLCLVYYGVLPAEVAKARKAGHRHSFFAMLRRRRRVSTAVTAYATAEATAATSAKRVGCGAHGGVTPSLKDGLAGSVAALACARWIRNARYDSRFDTAGRRG